MRFLTVLLLATAASAAFALPASVEEFQARQATEATTAQGAAKLWFDAALVYETTDPILGAKLLTIMMKDKQWASSMPYLLDTLRLRPYVLRSYIKGATPEQAYAINADAYELNVRDMSLQPFTQFPEGKIVRLMVQSGGAATPRFLDLERAGNGLYVVRNPGPLCVLIRPPSTQR